VGINGLGSHTDGNVGNNLALFTQVDVYHLNHDNTREREREKWVRLTDRFLLFLYQIT